MHMFITGFANIWLLPGGRTNLSRPCFFKYLKGREHFPPYRFGLISALHFLDACSILVKYLLLHVPRILCTRRDGRREYGYTRKLSHRVSIFGQVFRNAPLPLVVFEQIFCPRRTEKAPSSFARIGRKIV